MSDKQMQPRRFVYQPLPSDITLLRHKHYDLRARQLFHAFNEKMKLVFWLRDRERVRQIGQAASLEQLIELASGTRGLSEEAWYERVYARGAAAIPVLAERLAGGLPGIDRQERRPLTQRLVSALRWQETAGMQSLLEVFNQLDAYAKALVCMYLGLLKVHTSADLIWDFYASVRDDLTGGYFVGALWGLVDLEDQRAEQALLSYLQDGWWFSELFGFLSRMGQAASVLPLLEAVMKSKASDRIQPMMALVSVAHRIGAGAFEQELAPGDVGDGADEERQGLVQAVFARSPQEAQAHFELYYTSLTPEGMADTLNKINPG